MGARLMLVVSGADAALKPVSRVGVASDEDGGGIKRVGRAASSVDVEPHAARISIAINHRP